MEYELIREIFNKCSGNQMRDVFVSEVTTLDPEGYVREYLGDRAAEAEIDVTVTGDGCHIVDVVVDSLRQRFSFSPI